jgi:hypothetical protein
VTGRDAARFEQAVCARPELAGRLMAELPRREDVLRWLESRRVEPGDDGEHHAPKSAKRSAADGGQDGM